jgi:hypothetical protein
MNLVILFTNGGAYVLKHLGTLQLAVSSMIKYPRIHRASITMHRLTARLLLILLLVSIMAPAALAITAPIPHACCLRMIHDCTTTKHGFQFEATPTCCNRDCFRSLTVSQWAEDSLRSTAHFTPATTTLLSALPALHRTDAGSTAHSGRAPPKFSFSTA